MILYKDLQSNGLRKIAIAKLIFINKIATIINDKKC